MQVGLQARMNAKMMRKLTSAVTDNNVAFVMVQHLTTQIGTMARDPLIVSGGQAIKYGASVILDLRKRSMNDSDPFKKEEATKIGVTIQKNHVITDRFPYCKLEYYALFGKGIDCYLEIAQLAIDAGILVKSGAFIKVPDEDGNPKILPDGTKLQWQGNAKFKDYLIANPDFFNELKGKLTGKAEFLTEEEANEFLSDLGLDESGLNKLIKAAFKLLGLMTFLTAGEDECRAWTIKVGTKAPQAAGKIHSDIERGFIRAEIVSYDDLVASGSVAAAREKGQVRVEGKDYIMQDGDVTHFRFNV